MELPRSFDISAFTAVSSAPGEAWLRSQVERVRAEGASILPVLFPALARKTGRQPLPAARITTGEFEIECAAWRACDVAGHHLCAAASPSDEMLVDLFRHGDFEERSIVMRLHALQPIRPSTIELLGEAQRTNTQTHFESLVCDSNLLARAMRDSRFDVDSGYKIVLKAAFVDLPLSRFFGVLEHASEELSRYVTGLATEREAAGREAWIDTNRVIAHAPIDGSAERIRRGLTHADPLYRQASTEAMLVLERSKH